MTKPIALIDSKVMTELLGQTEQHLHYLSDTVAIHSDMLSDFLLLTKAAKKVGIELKIASGFRSFDRQLMLWNNKFSGKTMIKDAHGNNVDKSSLSDEEILHAILLFSALPGTSRHHWGCDIDVYASNLLADDYQLQLESWEYSPQGPLAELSDWLNKNAHKFGFYFPYATYQGGIAAEPWHLSYAPIAQHYQTALCNNLNIDKLAHCLTNSQILGKETLLANLHEIIKRYILNVHPIPENCYMPKLD